jgi:hypothetical protein
VIEYTRVQEVHDLLFFGSERFCHCDSYRRTLISAGLNYYNPPAIDYHPSPVVCVSTPVAKRARTVLVSGSCPSI